MSEVDGKVALDAALYFVATPIGNARDITLRALDIFRSADVLAAEDTRSLRRLLEIHGIPLDGRKVVSYHDHNGARVRPRLLAALSEGQSVAYASEAGTPLVADPGFALGRAAAEAGYVVTTAPGVSAFVSALTVSGLPSDRFLFAGFPPVAKGARRSFLAEFSELQATLVIYESPKRLAACLIQAIDVFGGDRRAAVCRELTKKFEEVRRGTLAELAEFYQDAPPKGEIVVCIAKGHVEAQEEEVLSALKEALETLRLKDAATLVSQRFGIAKRDVYQLGLKLTERD